MLQLLFRIMATLALVATSVVALAPNVAQAAPGDSPADAVPIQNNQNFTFFAAQQPGSVRWYRVFNPGGGKPLAITFHLRPQDVPDRGRIEVVVNIKRPAEGSTAGDPDKDVIGYNRIGAVDRTDNTGDARKFWLNFEGDVQPFFIKVGNYTDHAIGYAMTIKQNENPAEYVVAPDPSQITSSGTTTAAPSPSPVPAASATPVPAAPAAPVSPITPANPTPIVPSPVPTQATGAGSTVEQAEYVDILQPNTIQKTLQPGGHHWLKVEYPGDDRPVGVTLMLRSSVDPADLRNLHVLVNVRTREDTLGDRDVDAQGLARIGRLTPVNNDDPQYRFWTSVSGARETYFLLLQNYSNVPLDLALSFRRSDSAASYFEPTGAASTVPAATTAPSTSPTEPAPSTGPSANGTSPVVELTPAPSIADVVLGTTPLQAELVTPDNVTKQGKLASNVDYWYRIDYAGDNQPVGVTLSLSQSEDPAVLGNVTAYIDVRTADGSGGAAGVDWPGFDRIGQTTSADGLTRQFWTATSGQGQSFYIRVHNGSTKDVAYAITFTRQGDPASYAPPAA